MDDTALTNDSQGEQDVSRTPAPYVPQSQDFSGTTLGTYHLVRKVAEGGMGVVYEAIQTKLDRKVALKILTAELAARPEFLQRFEREAKAAAALNHPNVVQVHDFGEAHGWHYLIMEYVEGEDLSSYVEEHGKLSVTMALDVVEQAAQALRAAHHKAIIHRDIKPSNLMLTPAGHVKVSDLGLAKILTQESDVTVSGIGMGSPHYIAPEQADNARHVDHRADIYSLGLTLLFLLTGRRPFDGGTPFSVVLAHVNKPLPSGLELGTELPSEVEKLVHRMSAKSPDDRYPDYDALLADLQRVKAGFAPALKLPRKPSWKSAGLIITGTTVLVVVLGVLAFVWSKRKKEHASAPPAAANTISERADHRTDWGPPGEQFNTDRNRLRPRMQDGPGGPGGFGADMQARRPNMSGRNLLMVLGPPPQRNARVLADGPVEQMLAEADKYAAENKENYGQIVDNYWHVLENASGTTYERQIDRKVRDASETQMRVAQQLIAKYEAKMKQKLQTGTPQEAYQVWKGFPVELRNREVDMQIETLIEKLLPADFAP